MTIGVEVEICCDSAESCHEAVLGGADRIELCSALDLGGLTPPYSLIKWAIASLPIPVHVLIRPRPKHFHYSPQETELMLEDIRVIKSFGGPGVVVGALTSEGYIDYDRVQLLVDEAKPMEVTFHRAFDVSFGDHRDIMHKLYNIGITRLLTSGRCRSAVEGVTLLADLISSSPANFTVMPGCGITPHNCLHLLDRTGALAIHASASADITDDIHYANNGVYMGKETGREDMRRVTSADIVSQLKSLCNRPRI